MLTEPIVLDLPEEAKSSLLTELSSCQGELESNDGLRLFQASVLRIIMRHLPLNWLMLLEDVRSNRILPPYILFRNMPVDNVSNIPTPTDGYLSKLKMTQIAEAIQLGICQLIGVPFAFANERRNAGLIHLIAGRPGQEKSLTSESSKANLGYHVEHAFSKLLCPTWVTLICLRPDPEHTAVTGMADIRDLIPYLSKESLAVLQESIYVFRVPDSFGGINGLSAPMPVIDGNLSSPQFRISLDSKMLVVDADPSKVATAYNALNELGSLMERSELTHQVRLDTGDLLLMSNRTVAHCRTSFEFHSHLMNRWLHRVIATSSLFEARKMQTEKYNQFA